MHKISLKVSIVIPAYNEHNHIAQCLDAISKQSVEPHEVIVVDNGSTDNTAEIARSYPFVKVLSEKKRGVVFARDKGFNVAVGDIIGRIDVDTLLPSDWVARLTEIFQDKEVDAVSGGIKLYDIAHSDLIGRVDAFWRNWLANRMLPNKRVFLFGSNMAIRKSAWEKVKNEVCHEAGIHEDLDLALHMSGINLNVVFVASLFARVSARRLDSSAVEVFRYAMISPKTYARHRANEHFYMYPIVLTIILTYVLLRFWFRAYDMDNQKLTLKQLFIRRTEARVDPTTF